MLRIPVGGADWTVVDVATGKTIAAEAVLLDERTLSLPLLYINHHGLSNESLPSVIKEYENKATHALMFNVELPPVGYATFDVKKAAVDAQDRPSAPELVPQSAEPFTIANGNI